MVLFLESHAGFSTRSGFGRFVSYTPARWHKAEKWKNKGEIKDRGNNQTSSLRLRALALPCYFILPDFAICTNSLSGTETGSGCSV
jgi:hypothetical protein